MILINILLTYIVTGSGWNHFKVLCIFSAGGDYVFVGADDITEEGTFQWNNGDTVQQILWSSGEPNGGRLEQCAIMHHNTGFKLVDISCSAKYEFLCQMTLWQTKSISYELRCEKTFLYHISLSRAFTVRMRLLWTLWINNLCICIFSCRTIWKTFSCDAAHIRVMQTKCMYLIWIWLELFTYLKPDISRERGNILFAYLFPSLLSTI